jgi:hypothetical protein
MKTIEVIENQKTKKLQDILKEMEIEQNKIDLILENEYLSSELEQMSKDYEIDIHLIRMELTKRLWYNNFEK